MSKLRTKGLTMTIIFQAESANYGESVGNVSLLKKITRNKGEQYTYISRQAIRYNIVEQLGEPLAPINIMKNEENVEEEKNEEEKKIEKKVIQFSEDATIDKYSEVDFFGYLKTGSGIKKRSAKVRLSNAISLETFKGDLDFLTNKGQADKDKRDMNIAQAEIHKSYYRYTIAVDLDSIGIDEEYNIELDYAERARRVKKLLDTVSLLYRDIRGRREDLKPLFVIGGVYDIKNPVFHNVVNVRNNCIMLNEILGVMSSYIREHTYAGIVDNQFDNTSEVKEILKATTVPGFFEAIKKEVGAYYEGN